MSTRKRKPVDDMLDVALRQTLTDLGFKSRGPMARYFELPCENFNWFVAFGRGPRDLDDIAFTDATCVYVPELEKILNDVGEVGAGRPLRVNRKAHYYGSIEDFINDETREKRKAWLQSKVIWRAGQWSINVGDWLFEHWLHPIAVPFVLFHVLCDRLLHYPAEFRPHGWEIETPFYYGFFGKEKSELVGTNLEEIEFPGYHYGKGHYWDPRGRDIQEIGETIDRLWRQHCWPAVDSCRDFKAMTERYFPPEEEDFGVGPSLVSVVLNHLAGNNEAARELLLRIIAEGELDIGNMYAAYRDQHGRAEYRRMRGSSSKHSFVVEQLEARREKKNIAVKLAQRLNISLD